MEKGFQRRDFLKKAAGITAVTLAPSLLINTLANNTPSEEGIPMNGMPKLNRNYHIYCYQNGRVELRSGDKKETIVHHSYEAGMEVDLLLLIAANKSISNNIEALSERYSLNGYESRKKAEQVLTELKSKNLIYYIS